MTLQKHKPYMKEWDLIHNIGSSLYTNKLIFSKYFYWWYLMIALRPKHVVCINNILQNETSVLWWTDCIPFLNTYNILLYNKGKDKVKDLGTDGRIMFKLTSK
jgi:hypothetical protein